MGKPEFIINSSTGKMILDWCNEGIEKTLAASNRLSENQVLEQIRHCNNITELLALYKQYPEYQETLKPHYAEKKSFLIRLSNPQNFSTNGLNK